MRTLLALGAALSLATAPRCPLPARADGPGDLQAQARSLHLADDPAWADLLQYEAHPLTRRLRSLADDPGFLQRPGRRQQPRPPNSTRPSPACSTRPAPDDPDSHPPVPLSGPPALAAHGASA